METSKVESNAPSSFHCTGISTAVIWLALINVYDTPPHACMRITCL